MICLYLDILLLSTLFSGQKPEFTAWTRDARYYAKGAGFLSAFVSDPPQYIPVGELDTENSVLVDRGYSRKSVHIHALAWNFLSTALKSKSQEHPAQVYLAEGSVGRSFCMVRPSNGLVQVLLTNVAHMPHLRYYPFSLLTLVKNGHTFEGRPGDPCCESPRINDD